MLQVLYSPARYSYVTLDNDVRSGMIAAFTGNREVGVCRDGRMPIGFFGTDQSDFLYAKSVMTSPNVLVFVGQGEFKTDVYSPGDYQTGDLLYCGDDGKITNKRPTRGVIVGIVSGVDDEGVTFISHFANLENASRFINVSVGVVT